MQKSTGFKSQRMLELYVRLQQGDVLKKAQLAQDYKVTQRSIQRDMEDLRGFLAEHHGSQTIFYDRSECGYRLIDQDEMKLSNQESLAAIKILLESRSLTRQEMFPILEKLLLNCVPKDQVATIQRLIANEQHYYIEPHHGKEVLTTLWELGEAVTQQQRVRINYTRMKDTEPVTRTVETVVLLSKGEVDSKKIRVEFSLEDMDMSEFQDGATYTQIKDYVLEHSGLKVSNLYISQIKRKCGIEVGKNYNLPKSEDSRQPLCPPEKEKAIREAFKYFGII